MATEQEELRLSVVLDDRASEQLASLRAQLSSMSASMSQAGGNIGGKSTEATKAVKGLHTELTAVAGRAGFIGGAIGGITSELTKLGISIIDRATDLESLSRKMIDTSHAAHEMGTNTAQLRSNIQAFREVGVPIEQATRNLAGFSDAMADLTLINGQLRSNLLTGGFLDLQRMQQTLAKSDAAKNVQEQAGVWRHAAEEVRAYWTAMAGPQEGARRERQFLQAIGAPDLARLRRELEGVAAWQQTLFDARKKASDEYLEQSEKTSYAYERIGDSIGAIAIDMLNASGAAKAWAEYMNGVATAVERIHARLQTAEQDANKAAPAPDSFWGRLNPFDPRNATREGAVAPELKQYPGATPENLAQPGGVPFFFSGGGAAGGGAAGGGGAPGAGRFTPDPNFLSGSPESTNIEDRRALTEDNTDSLKELTEQLKDLNENIAYGFLGTQMGGLAPGLGGGTGRAGGLGGGAGAGGGMGALPGMGPGGYNPGGGTGPGNDSGTPTGTPGTNTGATPGTSGAPPPAWPDPSKGNVIPPGFGGGGPGVGGGPGPGIGGGAKVPWAGTVAPGGGGAFEGKPVATPAGWGPGGSGTPWGTTPPPAGGGGATGTPPPGGAAQAGGGGNDLSRESYDQMFKGTPLAGQYDNVVKAARANNVPPSTMAAVIAHETGKGTSAMVRDRNNPAGLMDPKTNWSTGQTFPNIEAGIEAAGRTIGKHYANAGGDLKKMASVYAPVGAANDPGSRNKYWPSGVATHQRQLQSKEASLGPPDTGGNGPGTSGVGPGNQGGGEQGGGQPGEIRLKGGSQGVNPQLYDIVREASRSLPEGYSAVLRSGVGNRPGGSKSYHPHGLAADIEIIGPDGKPIGDRSGVKGWYQDPKSFRAYEQFAQAAKAVQSQKYPNSPGFAWGGYFVNKGPGSYGFADSMHMQLGGPMAGGTWEGGAQGITKQWLERGGGVSAGMGQPGPSGFAGGGGGRTAQPRPAGVPFQDAPFSGGAAMMRADAQGAQLDGAANGAELDKAASVSVNAAGKLDVNVKAPDGTGVKAEGSGLFKKTSITRSTQMEPAEKGPTHSANADEE